MTYALRTDGDPMQYVAAVRQIVHDADRRVPVTNIKTQTADINETINQEIVLSRLCSTFAVLALLIAGVGVYGTTAYAVARRTPEIGIRLALGARRRAVVWMVMREVGLPSVLGLAVSLPIVRGLSRFVEAFLFRMTAVDPRTTALAFATLLGAALLASIGPARKAARIEPTTALRHE